MPNITADDIKQELGGALEDEIAEACAKLCNNYNKAAQDLRFVWEAMTINFGSQLMTTTLNKTTFPGFQDHIKQKWGSESAKAVKKQDTNKKHPSTLLRGGLMKSGGGSNMFLGAARVKAEPVAESSSIGGMTSERDTPRKAVPLGVKSNVSFTLQEPSGSNRAYRYMFEKVSERSEVLDDRIEDLAQIVKEHYDIPEFGDPSATTEEDIYVVGRVTLDSDSLSSGSVKMNEASLALETSRAMGSGVRMPFRFEPGVKVREGDRGVGGIGLFPGAIVALRGKNGGGGWFMVSEILSLPVPKTHVKQEEDLKPAFSMCIACGPYTTDADLKFRPWQVLLAKLKEEKPDVILLAGPFLDATHSWIKQGQVEATPSSMFRDIIITPLQEYLDTREGCLVIIVPSVRDLLSDHTVFPQAQFSTQLCNDPRVRFVPNPSRFCLNGVSFGVSTVDILFHLRKEEFFKRVSAVEPEANVNTPLGPDPMANLCKHLLEQRSYYPIFPVPQDLSHEVNLDVTHSDHLNLCHESASDAPEILIVPSRLKQFSKNVHGTTFVNPSFLTKGTYANLKYDGRTTDVGIVKLA
ncbi:DNA polymerase alpha, subunit B [Cristinia sonorae]|uniref:DNA polymerase alpha subunit B n=1 Tax=Cristinia sonorae TaxID=1940300 RepID=A0A8K0UVJ2_9AGAR|nr:DNA polymerase alpha, subunit B [Cristinia sonorae]